MKDIKDLSTKYWHIGLLILGVGIVIGILVYYIMYLMALDGIDRRLKENGRLGYVIGVHDYNIGCKGTPLCCGGSSLYSVTMEVNDMTKKEAVIKLKGEWRAAQTATKMKAVKALYNEVKVLEIADNEQLPPSIEQKVTNVG